MNRRNFMRSAFGATAAISASPVEPIRAAVQWFNSTDRDLGFFWVADAPARFISFGESVSVFNFTMHPQPQLGRMEKE